MLKDKAISLLAENFKDSEVPCRQYQCLKTGANIYYPLFLTFPSYLSQVDRSNDSLDSFAPLYRYSTNSGTAIGGNFEEAMIHAINEIVERDATSIFLLKNFLGSVNKIST